MWALIDRFTAAFLTFPCFLSLSSFKPSVLDFSSPSRQLPNTLLLSLPEMLDIPPI